MASEEEDHIGGGKGPKPTISKEDCVKGDQELSEFALEALIVLKVTVDQLHRRAAKASLERAALLTLSNSVAELFEGSEKPTAAMLRILEAVLVAVLEGTYPELPAPLATSETLRLIVGQRRLKAGDVTGARQVCKQLFDELENTDRKSWNYGNLVHDSNILNGFLALNDDRISDAAEALVRAAATPGSPQLNSFGPDLSLAWALLALGEDSAVLAYLKGVSKLWSPMTGISV